jgi:outer membrane biosynthesis protein TonB
MSYESKLARQSGKLLNPAKLCLLLSVGLHLLVLKFGLPSLNLDGDSSIREVSVIELSPEQQSRLPNASPQLSDPNIPGFNNNLPPADNSQPASPFAIPRSLIPGIGNPNNLPPVPIPPPPEFDLPPLPPITDITLPPVGNFSNLPQPPEPDSSGFKVKPSKVPSPPATTPNKPPTNLQQPQQPGKPAQTTAILEPPTNSQPQNQTQPQPQPTPEQIAAIKAASSRNRVGNLSQSLKKMETGTTDEDARKNYIAWVTKVKDIKHEKITILGTYPREACIRRLQDSSVFGVVVDETGTVVALDLIKGAKYPIFNQLASQDISDALRAGVADRTLDNQTKKPKPYQVTVNYKYDPKICPSLTLPSIRKAEEVQKTQPKQQPAPEPTPEPTPKPQPESKPQPQPTPAPKPQSKPAPVPKPKPQPQPESKPLPSLKDKLRNIPLPNLDPSELKDIPLPNKPDFQE